MAVIGAGRRRSKILRRPDRRCLVAIMWAPGCRGCGIRLPGAVAATAGERLPSSDVGVLVQCGGLVR